MKITAHSSERWWPEADDQMLGRCLHFATAGCANSTRGFTSLKSGVKRHRICDFYVKSAKRTVQLCVPAPEDEKPMQLLLNDVLVNMEPSSKSIGVSHDDMLPFTAILAYRGVRSGITTIAVDGDRLIGVSAGFCAERDPNKTPPTAEIRDYGPIIDSLASEIPSRKARRVVAPAFDLEEIIWNFMPPEVTKLMRVELGVVDQDYQSGGLLRHLIREQAVLGIEKGLEYLDCQLTAANSTSLLFHMGAVSPFHIEYGKMMDNGEPIHKKVPLAYGVDRVSLAYAPLNLLVANGGQFCTPPPTMVLGSGA